MRIAAVLAVAACAGSSAPRPPAPIANTVLVQPERWSLHRVLDTVTADTDVIFAMDSGRVRRAPLVADHWAELMALSDGAGNTSEGFDVCPHLLDRDMTLVLTMQARSLGDYQTRVWYLGLGRELLDCIVKSAAAPASTTTIRNQTADSMVVEADGIVSNYLLVDDRTLLVAVGTGIGRADLEAATRPAPTAVGSPDLARAVRSKAPIWIFFQPNGAGFDFARESVSSAVVVIDIAEKIELQGSVLTPGPTQAQRLAALIEPQLDQLRQLHYLDDGEVSISGDELAVRVLVERATAERIGRQFAPLLRAKAQQRKQPPNPPFIPFQF